MVKYRWKNPVRNEKFSEKQGIPKNAAGMQYGTSAAFGCDYFTNV
jgi:hypothetical protein